MKKSLSITIILLAIISCQRQDGIYKVENGWDIVNNGKTYEYRCEPDGMYLYIDWEGKNQYGISFRYKSDIYRRTVGHNDNYSNTTLGFLCKNKNGRYVYVANYSDFDGCLSEAESISMDNDETELTFEYKDIRKTMSLLEKYTSQ